MRRLLHNTDRKVFSCSYSHNVALKGYIITFVSADAETDNPLTELKAGIDLFGPDDEIFFYMCCDNEPASDNCMVRQLRIYSRSDCFQVSNPFLVGH